jgi:hypothetical protein
MLLFPAAQSSSINVSCKIPSKLDLSLENGYIFEEIYLTPTTVEVEMSHEACLNCRIK